MKSYTTYFVQSLPDLAFGSTLSLSNHKKRSNKAVRLAADDVTADDVRADDVTASSAPPDGGYGWVVVFAAFCNFTLIGGHWTGFSLIYATIAEYFSASYSSVGWVGSLCQAMTFLPGLLYAAVVVRLGCRTTCMLGSLLMSAGLVLSTCATDVHVLYLTYGVISGAGIGMIYISNVVIVQQYFSARRGLATGLAMAGLSAGSLTSAMLLNAANMQYGWRGALLIMAAFNLHGIACGALHRPLPPGTPARSSSTYAPAPSASALQSGTSGYSKISSNHCLDAALRSNENPLSGFPNKKLHRLKYCDTAAVKSLSETDITDLHRHSVQNAGTSNQKDDGMLHEDKMHDYDHLINRKSEGNLQSTNYMHTHAIQASQHCMKDQEQVKGTDTEKKPPFLRRLRNHFTLPSEICDLSLLRNEAIVLYNTATMMTYIGMMSFYMHAPSRALHYGIPPSMVALIPPSTAVFTVTSRVVFGYVSDCACVVRTLQCSLGMLAGALVEMTFVFSTSFPAILAHCFLFGTCNGIFATVQSTILVDLLSVEDIARSQALLGYFMGAGLLVATPFAGFLYDVTGSYDLPFVVCGGVQLLGGALLTAYFSWRHCGNRAHSKA